MNSYRNILGPGKMLYDGTNQCKVEKYKSLPVNTERLFSDLGEARTSLLKSARKP